MLEAITAALVSGMASNVSSAFLDVVTRRRVKSQIATVILQALQLDAKKNGQILEYPSGASGTAPPGELDALLPAGFRDWPGPIGVEVWLSSGSDNSLGSLLKRLSLSLDTAGAESKPDSLLFIHGVSLTDDERRRLTEFIDSHPSSRKIHIWGPGDVTDLIEEYRDQIGAILPELSLTALRSELQGPEPDWETQSQSRLARLSGLYRSQGVVLALGAGVSIGMGVPNWDELVSALFVSLVTKQLTQHIDERQALALADAAQSIGNESPLLSARYLRRGLEDGNAGDTGAFQQTLASTLYGHIGSVGSASPLLAELAKLCAPLRTGAKVHSVITYNFDDLLEGVLSRERIQHRSVYSSRHHADENELPIYHVHGFLPRDAKKYRDLQEGLLAFSEEGYHQLFKDPYHWTNVTQLQAFQQQTCVFVGLSLTDPNLRRLLEYAATSRDEPRHFAFMKRTSVDELLAAAHGNDEESAVTREAATDFLRVHHSLQERVFGELGLEVIWFDEYEKMPMAVAGLRG